MNLKVNNLQVTVEGKKILRGVSWQLAQGQVGALMGPNGSGKTTLGLALMGHPRYQVKGGQLSLGKTDLRKLKTHQRAKKGIFFSFQHPLAIPGVGVTSLLRLSREKEDFSSFYQGLKKTAAQLRLSEEFLRRPLNEDFSGGEKKKMELLQALVLQPKFMVLDEIDTGLDIDTLKLVGKTINQLRDKTGILLITHYQRILRWVKPDKVWILKKGQVVAEDGPELAAQVEKEGYGSIN